MDEITSTPVGRKAKAVINRLLQGRQLTEDGLRWLVQSTDPFHDTEITPAGYPTANPSRSVVRCVRKQAVLKKPVSLAAGSWDARIDALPLYSPNALVAGSYTTAGNFPTIPIVGFTNLFTPVSVVSGNAGFSIISDGATAVADNRWALSAADFTNTGRDRIVGLGYEVHDVSAELYKAGAVSSWRLGQGRDRNALAVATTPPVLQEVDWITLPQNNNNIAIYPDSVTWESREGVYACAVQNTDDNQPCLAQFRKALVAGSSPGYTPQNVGVSSGQIKTFNYDAFGSYFSGLSDTSVLSITVKYFIESFPSSDDATLLPLTRPTTPYDPVIMEIYSRAMREMPVAVMVKENPLGEWFDSVLQGIETIAPSLTGIPFIGPIAQAARPLASGIRKAMGTKQSKKKASTAASKPPS